MHRKQQSQANEEAKTYVTNEKKKQTKIKPKEKNK